MLNPDQFSLTASDFLWLVVSPELVTHTASRGWNNWCGEGAPSVDLHHYLSHGSQQLLRTALLRRSKSVDLQLTHPTRPARWTRLRLQLASSGLMHILLTDVHDLVEERQSLGLASTPAQSCGTTRLAPQSQGTAPRSDEYIAATTNELNSAERLRLFERLTEVSPEIIAIADTDHRIIYLNAAAAALDWSIGASIFDGYAEESRRRCSDTTAPVFDREGRWAGESALVDQTTQQEFSVYKRCFQLKNDKGKILAYAIVATDLREKKSLEDEIERQRGIFVQNAKMTALGEMASAIAHEINNPLAILKGQLSVLGLRLDQRDLYLPEAQEFMLAQEDTIERIALIVQGLRDFSRDGTNDPYEPLLAQDLIKQTLVFCEARFQFNHVTLEVGEPPHPLKLVGIKSQLGQALLNLLNNAFDATLKGAPPRSVRVLVETEGLRVRLMVRNSGPAISEGLAARIMQPFFTTKEAGKGTGLGLPIARAIVEQHGGRLYLLPHVSETTFVMELPRAD